MLHKARLFFSSLAISLFLVACTDAPAEEATNVDILEETTKTQTAQESETQEEVETKAEASEENSTNKEVEDETEDKTEDETTEDTAEAESKSSVEANSSTTENDSEAAVLESIDQAAIDQFVATTGLNVEDYTFSFETADQYVEMTVYEKQEDEQLHTPLAGIYRYMLDSEEILVQDYLTGAFIPYEEAE